MHFKVWVRMNRATGFPWAMCTVHVAIPCLNGKPARQIQAVAPTIKADVKHQTYRVAMTTK
jgi:hypothetical protein